MRTVPVASEDGSRVAAHDPSAYDLLFDLFFIRLLLCFYFLLQLLDRPLQGFKFLFSRVLFSRPSFRVWAGKSFSLGVTSMGRDGSCPIPRGPRRGRDIIIRGSPLGVRKVGHTLRHRSPVSFPCLYL